VIAFESGELPVLGIDCDVHPIHPQLLRCAFAAGDILNTGKTSIPASAEFAEVDLLRIK
jgi:hypothetical protein